MNVERVWPGSPHPLGATWDGEGTNFALFSEHATGVDLCLFTGPDDAAEIARIPMRERDQFIWHAYLPDVRPGTLYGYRVDGPFAPAEGHRFNPAKLLLDPYAQAITGSVHLGEVVFGHRVREDGDAALSRLDSAGHMPKCVVVDPSFPWGDDLAPRTPWSRTVIYECHVKGMTALYPAVPPELRGTFLGLAMDPVLDHLRALGVTAVELMPVQHATTEPALAARGLTNYWGYNSIGFFAPDARFATRTRGEQVAEFKTMVKRLHHAGIEVILDVVYNHTGEGGRYGPTLCLRGIDNRAYYRLDPADPAEYVDFTGCGNSLNMLHPTTIRLIMDSLRYWAAEMHVDGFRFDLAPALARELWEVNRLGTFFDIIHQDPVLSRVKLIAEPWDLGPGGYQVGNFPIGWTEWNGRYRDTVRRFWRGDAGQLGELASRLSGSSDLYGPTGRDPNASINFVTCHDGFTLRDLVTYEEKHNEVNGEDGRDGSDANWSRNWGEEGPTTRPEVRSARARAMRNLLATLAFSQGVPMLLGGDELGRSQGGNNNAYCLDDARTWTSWALDDEAQALLAFACRVFAVRRAHPVLRRRSFFQGRPLGGGARDLRWLAPDGEDLRPEHWQQDERRTLGMLMHAAASEEIDERGRPSPAESLLLVLNGGAEALDFRLPPLERPGLWVSVLDTARPAGGERPLGSSLLPLAASSLVLLRYEVAG